MKWWWWWWWLSSFVRASLLIPFFFSKAFDKQAHKKVFMIQQPVGGLQAHTHLMVHVMPFTCHSISPVGHCLLTHTALTDIIFALTKSCKKVNSTFLQAGAPHTLLLYSLVSGNLVVGVGLLLLSHIFIVMFCILLMSSYFPFVVWYFIPHHKFYHFCLVQLKMSFSLWYFVYYMVAYYISCS